MFHGKANIWTEFSNNWKPDTGKFTMNNGHAITRNIIEQVREGNARSSKNAFIVLILHTQPHTIPPTTLLTNN